MTGVPSQIRDEVERSGPTEPFKHGLIPAVDESALQTSGHHKEAGSRPALFGEQMGTFA